MDELRRLLDNHQHEIDSAAEYRALAQAETDPGVARVYEELATEEERHARIWEERLRARGVDVATRRPSWRAQILRWIARKFGAGMVLPTLVSREQPSHARVLRVLHHREQAAGQVARLEGRHRAVSGNALRAAVLGANDGLCSNLALVMGVAGASANAYAILIAGFAGLIAGAFSMALGEWISVTSSRELAERELGIERDELAASPEEERDELALLYEAKGLPASDARELAHHMFRDREAAFDALAREELGLDPGHLAGSARTAALTSFVLFALGALIPVLPFLVLAGTAAVATSIALSGAALFAVGAAITLFTGKSVWISGGRQLALGLAAAGLTYGVGTLLGVSLA